MSNIDYMRELRYLTIGVSSLREAAGSISGGLERQSGAVRYQLSELSDHMSWLSRQLDSIEIMLGAQLVVQREIVDLLRHPRRTAADELYQRATLAASRGLYVEAIRDFNKSIHKDWNQPAAWLGLGLAKLRTVPNSGPIRNKVLNSAAEDFERAFRYGQHAEQVVAARSLQMAVVTRDNLGQSSSAAQLLKEGIALERSPEVLFAFALRFRDARALRAAITLEPRYAREPEWQSLQFARGLVAMIRDSHIRVIAEVEALIGRDASSTADSMWYTASDCYQTYAELLRLMKPLNEAGKALRLPSPSETSDQLSMNRLSKEAAAAGDELAKLKIAYGSSDGCLPLSIYTIGLYIIGVIVVTAVGASIGKAALDGQVIAGGVLIFACPAMAVGIVFLGDRSRQAKVSAAADYHSELANEVEAISSEIARTSMLRVRSREQLHSRMQAIRRLTQRSPAALGQ